MVAPTTEQICCIEGNTPLYRHFQPKLPPTVNCRNVHELPGLPSHPKAPSFRQDDGTPNPLQTHLQGTFPAPLPKKCYGWHIKPPLEGLRGNSGVPSSWEAGSGEGGKAQKKVATKTTFIIIFPTIHREENSFDRNYLLNAVATSTATATVAPTIGLLPMPRKPIISTCAGTDEEPAN